MNFQLESMEDPEMDSLQLQKADGETAQEEHEAQVQTEDMHSPGKSVRILVCSPRKFDNSPRANNFGFNKAMSHRKREFGKGSRVTSPEKDSSIESQAEAVQSTGRSPTIKAATVSQGYRTSLMRVGPRLRAEGLMSPPASDIATLRSQLAALQTDLEARIEAEKQLKGFNQQLQERLELYMEQNHENLQRAASEMNTLHEDMEQTLELQSRLSERASTFERERKDLENALQKHVREFEQERAALQAQASSLRKELSQHLEAEAHVDFLQVELEKTLAKNLELQEKLHQSYVEAKYLKLKVDEFNINIGSLIIKEQASHKLESQFRRALLRRCFHRLHKGVEIQRIVNINRKNADALKDKVFSRQGFNALRKATNRAKFARSVLINQVKTTLRESFRAWHFLTTIQKRCEKIAADKARLFVCKAITRWKNVLFRAKLDDKKYHHVFDIALKHYNGQICKHFWKNWVRWVTYSVRPKRLKAADINRRILNLSYKQALAAWRCAVRTMQVKKLKLQQASYQKRRWLYRRSISRWKEFLQLTQLRDHLNQIALSFRKLHLWYAVFNSWKKYSNSSKHKRLFKSLALRHYLSSLKSKAIILWRHNVRYQQGQLRALMDYNQSVTRAALNIWRDYHIIQAVKKRKERRSITHKKRREQQMIKKLFLIWKELIVRKRGAIQLEHVLSIWWGRSLLLATFHGWMRETFRRVYGTNVHFQNQLHSAQAQYEEQKFQKTTVTVENIQLIDRLQSLSSEITLLKIHLDERRKREEELHQTLEDGAIVECSMRCELEQRRMHKEDLEKQLEIFQKSFEAKSSEDAIGEVQQLWEIRNLELNLNDFRCKLAEKSSQIESYEKALKETAERLEGASDESCEKLSSVFDIAASLRKLLEIHESRFAALEERSMAKDVELEDLRKRFATTNCTFSSTLESRDARIHELERLVARRQTEIREAHLDYQSLQVSLDAKDIHLRKLEYELTLSSGIREPINIKSFLTNQSSSNIFDDHDVSCPVQSDCDSDLANGVLKCGPVDVMNSGCSVSAAEKAIGADQRPHKSSSCLSKEGTSPSHEHQSVDPLELKSIESSFGAAKYFTNEGFLEDDPRDAKPVRGRKLPKSGFSSLQLLKDNVYLPPAKVMPSNREEKSLSLEAPLSQMSQISGVIGPWELALTAADGGGSNEPCNLHAVDHLQEEVEQLQSRLRDHLNDASSTLEELHMISEDPLSGRHTLRRRSFTESMC